MKLWYQSMSRTAAWGSYHKVLRRILDEVKDEGASIEIHGITKVGGVADQFRYLEYLETGEVMENVQIATRQGFDGSQPLGRVSSISGAKTASHQRPR